MTDKKPLQTKPLNEQPAAKPAVPLTEILGREPAILKALNSAGVTTLDHIKVTDAELLQIPGILPTRLKTIRRLQRAYKK